MNIPRRVLSVSQGAKPHWVGDGFAVRTLFSYSEDALAVSPFLLLDYAAPRDFPPTQARHGVGQHPHRGFETVTIAFQGEVEHRDSAGNHGRIGPGDVQWMTAASGVLHEEFHGREFGQRGGTFEMAQIWVNLPAKNKMSAPRYQDLRAEEIPIIALPSNAGIARVIAGEFLGVRGPAKTFTELEMVDLRLEASASLEVVLPRGHNVILLSRRGEVVLNSNTKLPQGEYALLDPAGDSFRVSAAESAMLLLLAGVPIHEPVVGYGPFVMNTDEEIRQALRDAQSNRMGRLS